jgi:hypothetical protein
MEKKMNVEDQKIINLENEVFEKLGEALDLMKKRSDVRLQLANKDGMPDELFKDFQTIQTERFKEIRNFLVAEYFVRFHNEIHFDSANTLAVIETQISCRFDEARRIENLKRFGEEFFAEEMPAQLSSETNQAA